MSLSFSPIFYSGVFLIALLVFLALYCLTSISWTRRLIYAALLALLTLGHQVLLDVGANYDVSIFPVAFFITTFITNIVVLSIPLALIIGITKLLQWIFYKIEVHLLPRVQLYLYSQIRKRVKRAHLAAQNLKKAKVGDASSSELNSAGDSSDEKSLEEHPGRIHQWLTGLLEHYLEKHYHVPLESLPVPTTVSQLKALNNKKGLPFWADGDDYTVVRNVRLEELRKSSGAISWSSGDGDQLIFTDSSGERTVVDTSIYNRIGYRDKFRSPNHSKEKYLASNGLLGWNEDVFKGNTPSDESNEEEEELIRQEATRVYAANHHGRSMQNDIDAATLAALDLSEAQRDLDFNEDIGNGANDSLQNQGNKSSGSAQKRHHAPFARWHNQDDHSLPHIRFKLRFWSLFNNCALLCFIIILALSGYSTFNVLKQPTVKSEVIALDVDPQFDGLTILQLSDLFIGAYYTQQNLTNIVRKATQLNPDIIVITGDLSSSPPNLALQRLYPLFRLSAPLGVYIVVGEDISNYVYTKFLDVYKSKNFMFLTNEWVDVPIGKRTMHIMGVANHSVRSDKLLSVENLDITSALCNPDFQDADFSLVLANSAAYAREYHELAKQKINFIITGNTMGNVMHFLGNLLGFKTTHTYYPDLYRISDSLEMYVSGGTNIWPRVPIRLLQESEITLFLIHSSRLQHEPQLPRLSFH